MKAVGVATEIDCTQVRISQHDKLVYMRCIDGSLSMFSYEINCLLDMDTHKINFFFNIKTKLVLIVEKAYNVASFNVLPNQSLYTCTTMKFWLTANDSPRLSVNYFQNEEKTIGLIENSFKEQLFAYKLDEEINS